MAMDFALDSKNIINVGVKNPADSADGNAGVVCNGRGAIIEGLTNSILSFYGLNNTWADSKTGGGLELAIAGTLSLTHYGDNYQQTTLNVTDGNVHFVKASGIFKTEGQGAGTPGQTWDRLTVSGSGCNLNIDPQVFVRTTCFGKLAGTAWDPVISVTGGGGIQGTFLIWDKGWTGTYLPPDGQKTMFFLDYTG